MHHRRFGFVGLACGLEVVIELNDNQLRLTGLKKTIIQIEYRCDVLDCHVLITLEIGDAELETGWVDLQLR